MNFPIKELVETAKRVRLAELNLRSQQKKDAALRQGRALGRDWGRFSTNK